MQRDIIVGCPICGEYYTHLTGYSQYMNDNIAEKRLSLLLTFYCEANHYFEMLVEQHEGVTTIKNIVPYNTDYKRIDTTKEVNKNEC